MENTIRKNAVMSYSYDSATRIMAWDFGAKIGVVEFVLPTIAGISERDEAALHNGFKQKIADAAALGQGSSPADKFAAMTEVVDNLVAGRWNLPRGESDVGTYLARAIVEHTGKSLEGVRTWLAGKKPAERAALAAQEPFAGLIAGYRKAKVAGVEAPNVDEIPD
jgi:hypothetical protein